MPTAKRHIEDESYLLRLESTLMEQVRNGAKAKGQTIKEFMEDAIRAHVRNDIAARNDAAMAPMIAELLASNIQAHSGSLRKLVVRLAYEMLRQHYLLCEFMTRASVSPKEIAQWREQGWRWAVKALKEQPSASDDEGP